MLGETAARKGLWFILNSARGVFLSLAAVYSAFPVPCERFVQVLVSTLLLIVGVLLQAAVLI